MPPFKIVVIENENSHWEIIQDCCNQCGIEAVTRFTSLSEFQNGFETTPFDLMIADLRLAESIDDRSGWEAVKKMLTEEIIPVIVYSGYANEEINEQYKNIIIKTIRKGSGPVFQSTLKKFIAMKQKILAEKDYVASIFGSFTLETIGKILQQENDVGELNENTLAFMIRSKLFSYLINTPIDDEKFLPAESIFIYPPLKMDIYSEKSVFLGDFIQRTAEGENPTLWFVVSPSCDIAFSDSRPAKIKEILVLPCYQKHSDVPFLAGIPTKNGRKKELELRTMRQTHKILKCPKQIFETEHIVISFKGYKTVPYAEITTTEETNVKWKKLATLATPYSESIQNLFVKDLSRIGTPDTVNSSREEKWIKKFVD